jgi:xanthine dehydrogenase YagS FAD-binding subunit
MNRFSFVDCTTVSDALNELDQGAVAKAGGIDLLDLMKDGIVSPPKLVNIRNIDALRGVDASAKGLSLGPLTTLSELASHPAVREQYTALSDSAGHAATPQVRNMATLGGNIMQRSRCWYFRSAEFHCRRKGGSTCFAQEGENQYHAIIHNHVCGMVHPSSTAVPLMAFGAQVELASKKGKRTVPFETFYIPPEQSMLHDTALQPGELITNVFVPAPASGTRSAYQKYGDKESFDWPIADAGVVLTMDGNTCKRASIVLGAAAPTPIHAKQAETLLAGKVIDESIARAAGKAAIAGATPLPQNSYKLQLFQTAVYRTILLAAGQMDRDPSAIGGMA